MHEPEQHALTRAIWAHHYGNSRLQDSRVDSINHTLATSLIGEISQHQWEKRKLSIEGVPV